MGGWGRRGSGVPLSERVRAPATPDGETGPARHCWVADPVAGSDGTPSPGLLLEWRCGEAGWEGRVVYLAPLRPTSWALVEEWLPARALRPT